MSTNNVKINNGVEWEIDDVKCDELVDWLNQIAILRPEMEVLVAKGFKVRVARLEPSNYVRRVHPQILKSNKGKK